MRSLRILSGPCSRRTGFFSFLVLLGSLGLIDHRVAAQEAGPGLETATGIERRNVIDRTRVVGINGGAGFGSFIFGGREKHDIAFLNIQYGEVFEPTYGEGAFWEGKWMIVAEATAGREFHTGDAGVLSLTPMLRYLFNYPGKVVPFLEAGVGLTWTDLREPDLSGDFQFNSQGGGGLIWFPRPEVGVIVQYRFVHYSNAGIQKPNTGVNMHGAMAGISYFF